MTAMDTMAPSPAPRPTATCPTAARADSPAWVLLFADVEEGDLALVGGKGLSLGRVAQAGLNVPAGFCVTTRAYLAFVDAVDGFAAARDALDGLRADDATAIRTAAAQMRALLLSTPLPAKLRDDVDNALAALPAARSVAVRSSATLEDLPEASFAGQHDSHLEISGLDSVMHHIQLCFASLFTDRAVAYRRRQGLREDDAAMCVVVQAMAASDVAGVLFTVDPISGHRGHCIVDASYGLGEAVVSGVVNPDNARVRKDDGAVVDYAIGDKAKAIRPRVDGGTTIIDVDDDRRRARALTDAQLSAVVDVGRRLEALYGVPQDVEWGIEDGNVVVLQSRPITSLFPLPSPLPDDGRLHAYMCAGHQQANPAAWSPLGISLFGLVFAFGQTPPSTPTPAVFNIGHRLYVDFTVFLHKLPTRVLIPRVLMAISPAVAERMVAIVDRPDFVAGRRQSQLPRATLLRLLSRAMPRVMWKLFFARPEDANGEWATFMQTQNAVLDERLDVDDVGQALDVAAEEAWRVVRDMMLPVAVPNLLPGVIAMKLLERLVQGRVDPRAVTTLSSGLEGNIVTEMDAALADLAEAARGVTDVEQAIQAGDAEAALAAARQHGADDFTRHWTSFMDAYGHRGAGEIDVARPRWRDDPAGLLNTLSGLLLDAPHAHRRRLGAARAASQAAEADILQAAGKGVFGRLRRRLAKWCIRRIRGYAPHREHHKFWVILLWGKLRRVFLKAGAAGVDQGWLDDVDDVFMLSLEELRAAFAGRADLDDLATTARQRRQDHVRFQQMAPPPLLLSTGEVPAVVRKGGPLPDGVVEGVPVSAGVVEGVARVLRDPSDAILAPGEILVAPFTDAAWTTLFVHAGGVVLEAGGAMSHGSVIAREYGIPAVVGLADATTLIATGSRIRVDGESGLVTLLDDNNANDNANDDNEDDANGSPS